MPFEAEYSTNEPTREEVDSFNGPVLIEFGADWCPHCQALAPRLRDALNGNDEVRHIKVADGKGKRLGRSFRVKLWPSLIFMRDGKLLIQLARPTDAELRSAVAQLVQPDSP